MIRKKYRLGLIVNEFQEGLEKLLQFKKIT